MQRTCTHACVDMRVCQSTYVEAREQLLRFSSLSTMDSRV